jgi:hypothetical protein
MPKIKIIPPDRMFQKPCGTSISNVDAFKISEKRIMLTAKDIVTITGFFRSFESAELPMITGKSGSTQGAKIVKIPAIKEDTIRAILIKYLTHVV